MLFPRRATADAPLFRFISPLWLHASLRLPLLNMRSRPACGAYPGGKAEHLTGVTSVPSKIYSLSMNAEQ